MWIKLFTEDTGAVSEVDHHVEETHKREIRDAGKKNKGKYKKTKKNKRIGINKKQNQKVAKRGKHGKKSSGKKKKQKKYRKNRKLNKSGNKKAKKQKTGKKGEITSRQTLSCDEKQKCFKV